MSVGKSKQQELGNDTKKVRGPISAASRSSNTKKQGTRWGTIEDWREGSQGASDSSAARRKRLRDGS